ncbi:MAG: hypothetical protein DMF21_13940 [Verrucomicrobia bacterium]|nr:MAG: hypothetical protein DMF21_13940 [Verrucomicrobiota bacterium]
MRRGRSEKHGLESKNKHAKSGFAAKLQRAISNQKGVNYGDYSMEKRQPALAGGARGRAVQLFTAANQSCV